MSLNSRFSSFAAKLQRKGPDATFQTSNLPGTVPTTSAALHTTYPPAVSASASASASTSGSAFASRDGHNRSSSFFTPATAPAPGLPSAAGSAFFSPSSSASSTSASSAPLTASVNSVGTTGSGNERKDVLRASVVGTGSGITPAASTSSLASSASLKIVSPDVSKVIMAQKMFIGGQDLTMENRRHIMEGDLTKICRKAPKLKRFFLFDDILVYGQYVSKNKLTKQCILSLADLSVKPVADERGLRNSFQISSPKKSFLVSAESAEDRNRWVKALNEQIKLQSAKEGHTSENMAALWKPDYAVQVCMNCGATRFSAFNRKHHCRGCGKVVCAPCSEYKMVLPHLSQNKAVRVCVACYGSGLANLKQTTTGRLAWLCDSDSDSDIEDLDTFQAPVEDVRFERYHRSNRVHGI